MEQVSSQETCLICGDTASGKHYGLRSCEACKAFFKRTVQGKIEYSCPATRECEINKRRRKACQACRFQKCLNMGMLKEGVRLDRVRGGRQKYRRGLSPTPNGNLGTNSDVSIKIEGGVGSLGGGSGGVGGAGGAGGRNNVTGISGTSSSSLSDSPGLSVSGVGTQGSLMNSLGSPNLGTSETNRIITALINCEPEELNASSAQLVSNIPSSLSVQMKTLYILSDLFDRELVSLIGWAKQIPGFSETITLNDQMRLLQSSWAEVIALSIGYRSHLKRLEIYRQQHTNGAHSFMNTTSSPTSSSPVSTASSSTNHNGNSLLSSTPSSSSYNNTSSNMEDTDIKLMFAKDLMIDFKHAAACGAESIFYNCVQLIKRLDSLKITPKEYILLKAISLINADVRLENPKATHQLRDLIMDTLYQSTLADHQLNSRANEAVYSLINQRLNQVLLCLPVLRSIDTCIRKFWSDIKRGPNHVPMNKLFEEMLEPMIQ